MILIVFFNFNMLILMLLFSFINSIFVRFVSLSHGLVSYALARVSIFICLCLRLMISNFGFIVRVSTSCLLRIVPVLFLLCCCADFYHVIGIILFFLFHRFYYSLSRTSLTLLSNMHYSTSSLSHSSITSHYFLCKFAYL